MKNIFLFVSIVFVLSACATNSEKKSGKVFTKGLTGVTTTYQNIENVVSVSYNTDNTIASLKINEIDLKVTYNENQKPLTIDFYADGKLSSTKNLTWFKDSVEMIGTEMISGIMQQNSKVTYTYNANEELCKIYNYVLDSLGNWVMMGTRYEFVWQDGNIINYKCYIPSEGNLDSLNLVSSPTEGGSWIEADKVDVKASTGGFMLYYETTLTYDDKNNPYSNLSLSQLFIPGKVNISKNNPITIHYKYNDGETINRNCTYEYNEKGFPVKMNIVVDTNIEGFGGEYVRIFTY